jgi:glycerol kinase
MGRFILAIDQGTTSCRAIIFDRKSKVVEISQEEITQIYPQSGWVEHDPNEILKTQQKVISQVIEKSKVNVSDIHSIGITNQRETVVVWNKKTGEPVCNAIVWQDTRTTEFCNGIKKDEELTQYIHKSTGLVVDSYFSGSKIKWILDKQENKENLIVGTIDSWLLWNFTKGKVHATDVSNASRTMLFNIEKGEWDKKLLSFFNVDTTMLPEVKNSSDDFGFYEINGVNIPINGIAGDQQAALFGQNCFEVGQAKNTYGTGCFMLMNTGDKLITSKSGLLTTIAWGIDGKLTYALEGSVFIAGSAIQWLRDELKMITNATESEKMALASTNENVYVVPAFSGLGAPHWNMNARGGIFGLTRDVNRNDFVKATLNSLAYQTKDIFNLMEEESEIKLEELAVDGGASLNNYLMQFQADILNKKTVRPSNHECTAKGVVFLAGLKSGFWTKEDLSVLKENRTEFIPNMSEEKRDNLYAKWLKAVNLSKDWED